MQYTITVKGVQWTLEEDNKTKWVRVYGMDYCHYRAIDLDAALQYIWTYANDRSLGKLTRDDLRKVEEND